MLLGRIEHAGDGPDRAQLLRQLAEVYETGVGDLRRAFEAVTTACQVDPERRRRGRSCAEKLAAATGGWADLVAEASEIATDAPGSEDRVQVVGAARRLVRDAARSRRLRAAVAAPRARARPDEPRRVHARSPRRSASSRSGRTSPTRCARTPRSRPTPSIKVDLLLGLGDLLESQLASTAKAIEAYQQAAADARRRSVRRRARRARAAVPPRRAVGEPREGPRSPRRDRARRPATRAAPRPCAASSPRCAPRSSATSRARSRATRPRSPPTAATRLRSRRSSISTTRPAAPTTTSARWSASRWSRPRARSCRRCASSPPSSRTAIRPARVARVREAARRRRERRRRVPRARARARGAGRTGTSSSTLYARHIAAAKTPAQRVELYLAAAQGPRERARRPAQGDREHCSTCSRSTTRTRPRSRSCRGSTSRPRRFDRAVDILVKHAALEGDRGAPLYAEAGRIALEQLARLRGRAAPLRQGARDRRREPRGAQGARRRPRGPRATRPGRRAAAARRGRVGQPHRARRAAVARRRSSPRRKLERHRRARSSSTSACSSSSRITSRRASASPISSSPRSAGTMRCRCSRCSRARPRGSTSSERSRREAQLGKAYEAAAPHREGGASLPRSPSSREPGQPRRGDRPRGRADARGEGQRGHRGRGRAVEGGRPPLPRDPRAPPATSIADGQVAEIWYRLGVAARALGEDKKAEASFRRALEKEPLHEATLDAMVELGGAARRVEDGRRRQARADRCGRRARRDRGPPREAVRGDRRHLRRAAQGCRLRGRRVPGGRQARRQLARAAPQAARGVHRAEELAEGDRRRSISCPRQETTEDRRARFHYTAAVIARDELQGRRPRGRSKFNAALDDAPFTPKAFEAIDKLLSEKKDWKNLARAYRRQLKRMGEDAAPERAARAVDPARRHLPRSPRRHRGRDRGVPGRVRARARRRPAPRAARRPLPRGRRGAPARRRSPSCSSCSATRRIASSSTRRSRACIARSTSSTRRSASRRRWCSSAPPPTRRRMLYERLRPSQFTPGAAPADRGAVAEGDHPPEGGPPRRRDLLVDARRRRGGHGAADHRRSGSRPRPRTDLDRDPRTVSRIVKYVVRRARDRSRRRWCGCRSSGDGLRVANTVGLGAERAAAGAVAARRRAADRQERRARARVRGRQADGVPASRAVRDARGRHAAQARGGVRGLGARQRRARCGRTTAPPFAEGATEEAQEARGHAQAAGPGAAARAGRRAVVASCRAGSATG